MTTIKDILRLEVPNDNKSYHYYISTRTGRKIEYHGARPHHFICETIYSCNLPCGAGNSGCSIVWQDGEQKALEHLAHKIYKNNAPLKKGEIRELVDLLRRDTFDLAHD